MFADVTPFVFILLYILDIFRSDLICYEGIKDTIVSVGLVKPKENVFQNFVKYLLVLCTTNEITFHGVTFTVSSEGMVVYFILILPFVYL